MLLLERTAVVGMRPGVPHERQRPCMVVVQGHVGAVPTYVLMSAVINGNIPYLVRL
jgi:hypothetical protein